MCRILFSLLIFVLFFSSCMMRKVELVKDMSPDSLYKVKAMNALKIQPNDRLSIIVFSKNPELSAPFNTDLGGYSLATEADLIKNMDNTNVLEKGYLVDEQGFILFPVLGKLKVSGLSMDQIQHLISNEIQKANYIEDPLVKVNLLNFKVLVIGETENQIISVPDGRITLFDVIAKSRGINANADAQRVVVIREQGGYRKLITANLESYDVFNSEAYLLQQNDIVYVSPKYKQVTPGTQSAWQMIGMLLGVVSLSFTAAALFIRK